MGGVADAVLDTTLNIVTGGVYGQAQRAREMREQARQMAAESERAFRASQTQEMRLPIDQFRRRRASRPGFTGAIPSLLTDFSSGQGPMLGS